MVGVRNRKNGDVYATVNDSRLRMKRNLSLSLENVWIPVKTANCSVNLLQINTHTQLYLEHVFIYITYRHSKNVHLEWRHATCVFFNIFITYL